MTNESLRIAIACYPTYGGSGILATELGAALATRGHEVHLLAYSDPPRLPPGSSVRVHRVEVSAYPLFKYPPYDLALASRMLERMADGLDVLHAHYAIPHALCAWLARQMCPTARTRIVTTLHGTDITVVGSDPAYREVTRFGIEHSDRVIAVSRFLAAETRRIFAVERDIDVLPNFVDTSRFRPEARADRDGGPPLLVHVSNFRPVKRPQDVVLAFEKIVRDGDARLLLVGDGPELLPCLRLAESRGLASRVESLGNVPDVERVLASADLLLLPSGSEAFGLAALEAMACGVPVVAYRAGGLPEVVVDGETGFLVPFQDVEALAARALEILRSRSLQKRLGAAGRARSLAEFTVEKSVRQHEALYRAALEAPPLAPAARPCSNA